LTQCFIVIGSAGSGKTFLGSILKEYNPNSTIIFTPTGRAAKIFRSMIRHAENGCLIIWLVYMFLIFFLLKILN